MHLSYAVVTDRTGLIGAGGGLFAGLPSALVAAYLLLRLLIPVLLIVLVSRGATPVQRIGLVRDYLLGAPTPPRPPAPEPPPATKHAENAARAVRRGTSPSSRGPATPNDTR
jgi:hypothetical protein